MMNEEKRDRMIRESLDKYLSGIDALPSQRAAISKSLVDRPPFFRRAAFRAVAVPAALTLLVCAGIGVFAGLQNHTAYPDHVKTDETLVAVQPEPTDFIALAAPEGEEGGADTVVIGADGVTWDQWGAVVPTVEPAPEVTVRLAEFISLWREQRWADILKICTPDWTSQYENPEARLAELASFVTPGAYEIESVTEIGEVFVGGYSIDFTVRDQDNPDALYRVNLSLKKESDSRLYAYPETLDYYKVMAPQELIEATEAERLNRAITADSPELAAALAPVNTACEEAGIRLEIISAAMNRDKAIIVYSLQDLEGMQVSMDAIEDYPSIHFDWISNYASTSYPLYTYWDEAQDKFTCARAFLFDNPIDQVNLSGRVFMEMCNVTTARLKETDLIPLLRQYGSMAGNLTELPLDTYVSGFAPDNEYTEAELRELGFKVLDPSKALDVQLGDYVTLTAIGVKDDGLLHLQLRYPDNCGWWFPQFISASGVPLAEDSSGSVPCTYVDWSGSWHNAGCWLEAQFSLEGEIADNASLIVGIYEIPEFKLGEWKTEFTVGQVWAGEGSGADNAEAPAAETEAVPETPDPAEEPAEAAAADPYSNVRLVKFFRLWREQDWQGMLKLCASAWTEQTENPEKALEDLASFVTPDSFEIVSAVSVPDAERPEYTMHCTIRDKEAEYRAEIRMAKGADGLWYVFPDSLKEYETVPAEETRAWRRKNPAADALRYTSPDLWDKLVPLNLVCESSGIRLEIISAAMDEDEALIFFSVQDLDEGRADYSVGTVMPPAVTLENGYGGNLTTTRWYMNEDTGPNKVTIGEHIVYDKALDPAELSDLFTLSLDQPELVKGTQLDLVSLLQQYGEQTGGPIDPPMLVNVRGMSHTYTSDELRDQGVKVLDPSRSLEVQLSDNIYLSGIKLDEDRLLHLQLRCRNQHVWYPQLVNSTDISWNDFVYPEDTRCLTWSGTYYEGDWLEYRIRPVSDLTEDSSLLLNLYDSIGFVRGDWSVKIPAAQIWFGKEIAAGNAEAPAAETETAPETPDPAEAPAETVLRDEPYANVRLVKFFRLWREQDWQGMLDMCTSGWKAQAEDPMKALESIASIRKPEIVSMNPLPAAEPEYIMECIVRSGEDRDAWYRLTAAMEKEEDGLWYVNPAGLKAEPLSEEEISSHRSLSTGRSWYFAPDTNAIGSTSDSMAYLRYQYPRLVEELVPVELSCESDGIRLEIISAAVEEDGSLILYSLKDLTGDRIGREREYNPFLHINGADAYAEGLSLYYLETDAAEHYASYAMYIPGNYLYSAGENLKFSLDSDLLFYNRKETDLLPHLRKYEDRTWKLADLPEDATLYPYYPGYEMSAKGLGIRVLDSTDPLNIPLDENVTLNGIGYAEDGLLHIRMHIGNNGLLTDSSGYEYRPVFNIAAWQPYTEDAGESSVMWTVEESQTDSQIEFTFRCTRDSLNKSGLRASVYTTDCYAHGSWEIEIQADSVRK